MKTAVLCKTLRVSTENECQVISCALFHPEYLAKIERCNPDNNQRKEDGSCEITQNTFL